MSARSGAVRFCRLVTPETRNSFGASSLATIVQMVANGYGVTLLPGDGDRKRDASSRRYPPVALQWGGAEAGDRAGLAQDQSAQSRLRLRSC